MPPRFPRGALIVGAGAAAFLHAISLRAHGVPIAAIYDPERARARRLAELVGDPPVLEDLDRLDQREGIDCISICSPPRYHAEQAELCAGLGGERLILLEKPVAVAREELVRLERLPLVVPIVQWRAGRAIRAVRQAIAEGLFGATPSVAIDLAWHRDGDYFSNRARYDQWGCGALLSVGIHALDAVCFALDRPIAEVHGALGYTGGIEVETRAALTIAFRGGAVASLRITFDAADDETRITFCGAGVTATISGGEADPTATTLDLAAREASTMARLRWLERRADGSASGPLLIPFIGGVLESLRNGLLPGESPNIPSVDDVAIAHAAIFRVYEGEPARYGCNGAHEACDGR